MSLSLIFSKAAYVLFLGFLLLNLHQKKYGKEGEKKRFATMYLGLAVMGIFLAAGAIIHSERIFDVRLNDLLILPAAGFIAYYVYLQREKTFPFRTRCGECGAKLPAVKAFFIDGDLCGECVKKKTGV